MVGQRLQSCLGASRSNIEYPKRLPLVDRGRSVKLDIAELRWSRRAARLLPEADVTVTNCFWLPWLLRSRDGTRFEGGSAS